MVTKKKNRFFKSLRFRIMVILVILGIVPGIIATQLMIGNYKQQAIEVRTGEIRTQCAILCNQIIKENYLNDPSPESINSKLEVLANAYGGRIMLVDRDFKVVKDTTLAHFSPLFLKHYNQAFHFPGGHTLTEQEVKTWYAPLAQKMLMEFSANF